LAKDSIRDINDVNRMIKNKAKYFKTLYIRFLAKNDVVLDKEVTDMVNNLRTYGAKTTAKASSI
jgi:flagellar basal body rod protein FlgB